MYVDGNVNGHKLYQCKCKQNMDGNLKGKTVYGGNVNGLKGNGGKCNGQ